MSDIDVLIDETWAALDEGALDRARALIQRAESSAPDYADVWFARGEVEIEAGDLPAAERALLKAVELEPDHADAWHALGQLAEERGAQARVVECFSQVLRLDQDYDEELLTPELLGFVEQRAGEVLHALPEPFAGRLANVPVVIELRPDQALVTEGFDPRAFGLFEGADDRAQAAGADLHPSRIVLFAANLAAAFPEREELADEIELTLLHEIGHFFGLDEDEVERLGLG